MTKKKKKKNYNWLWFLVIIVILLALIFVVAFKLDWITQQFIPGGSGTPGDFTNLTSDPDCTLSLDKYEICTGDSVIGTTIDGDNANCFLGVNYNSRGWQILGYYTLNNEGRYSSSRVLNTSGNYLLAVVCYKDKIPCRTNDVTLIVRDCGDDGSDTTPCYISCRGIGYTSGWGPVDSPGRCITGESYEYFEDYACCCSGDAGDDEDYTCYDTDAGYDIYKKGTCTSYGYSNTDYCYDNGVSTQLIEYQCINNYCTPSVVSCPYMQDACSDGACWDLS
jgi:hypothetical protein